MLLCPSGSTVPSLPAKIWAFPNSGSSIQGGANHQDPVKGTPGWEKVALGCGKSGLRSLLSSPPPFQDVFQGRVSQQIRAWAEFLALAEEGNICLNQLGYSVAAPPQLSAPRERQNRGKNLQKRGFCLRRRNFLLGKFPRAGKEERRGEKKLKPICFLVKKSKKKRKIKKKISISNGARFLRRRCHRCVPSPQKDVLSSSGAG